jgi:molybdopterin-guanine dinucleotide biosynthesis protein A
MAKSKKQTGRPVKPPSERVKPLILYIPNDTKARVQEIAATEGRTPSQMFQRAMADYCEKYGHEWEFGPQKG